MSCLSRCLEVWVRRGTACCARTFHSSICALTFSHRWHEAGNGPGRGNDQDSERDDRESEWHVDGGFGGEQLLPEYEGGDHDHPGDAHDAERHQHRHQSDTGADAVEPELKPRAGARAAAAAAMLFESSELVQTS